MDTKSTDRMRILEHINTNDKIGKRLGSTLVLVGVPLSVGGAVASAITGNMTFLLIGTSSVALLFLGLVVRSAILAERGYKKYAQSLLNPSAKENVNRAVNAKKPFESAAMRRGRALAEEVETGQVEPDYAAIMKAADDSTAPLIAIRNRLKAEGFSEDVSNDMVRDMYKSALLQMYRGAKENEK